MATTTYIKLTNEAAGTASWADHLIANWDKVDKYHGQSFFVGTPTDPNDDIGSDFVGQRLIEVDVSGDFVRLWIAQSRVAEQPGLAGNTVWITERQQNYIWEKTQLAKIYSGVLGAGGYQIDLAESNFFRFNLEGNVILNEPQYNGVDLSASTEFLIGQHTASFQMEIRQDSNYTITYTAPYWAFPYGGTPPPMSPNTNDIDFLFCTVRFDGRVHVGYNPLSVGI